MLFVHVPAVFLWLGIIIMAKASELACTAEGLVGIVQGGGAGVLDLDKVTASLGGLNADEGTAPIFANADCSSGLETPVAMRTLLGESLLSQSEHRITRGSVSFVA